MSKKSSSWSLRQGVTKVRSHITSFFGKTNVQSYGPGPDPREPGSDLVPKAKERPKAPPRKTSAFEAHAAHARAVALAAGMAIPDPEDPAAPWPDAPKAHAADAQHAAQASGSARARSRAIPADIEAQLNEWQVYKDADIPVKDMLRSQFQLAPLPSPCHSPNSVPSNIVPGHVGG
eukprot:gb/GFBE01064546.1/.p1 GENE.gb/GFBE01064546.1/~~gb/GFBE01064546.1/.p1  ORF type:complete len:176 (+),score=16.62 gb/GFBE01064546.1/:1-528(+)